MAFGFLKRKKKEKKTDSRYLNLTVKEVIRETADAVTLVFEKPEQAFDYIPGQFITLILDIDGNKYRRAYSLCSSPYLDEDPAVTIKRVEGGVMSNHANQHIKAGDVIQVMEPMGSFILDINADHSKHVFLFGGGSGITPLLSIAKSILAEESGSKVSLIYANRDVDSIIFKSTIEKLAAEHQDRLSVTHFLENPSADWDGKAGFVTQDALKEIITSKTDSFEQCEFMTCGPEPMMNIVMDTWKSLDVPSKNMHRESFVAGNTSPREIIANDPKNAEGTEVTILLDGEEHKYVVANGKTILEAGLDENIDMPYSCQSGLCTACRGKCLSGEISMDEDDGLSAEEKNEGYVLLCTGHPKTEGVVVEIG